MKRRSLPGLLTILFVVAFCGSSASAQRLFGNHQGASTALRQPGPVAVCTTEELEDLFALAKQQDRSHTDVLGVQWIYLAYEDATLRQYVKFTFGTVVFIQSKGRENGQGLDEIDHWIVTAGLDGHVESASHDQIVEDKASVVTLKELPNSHEEAASIAQGIIARFLGSVNRRFDF